MNMTSLSVETPSTPPGGLDEATLDGLRDLGADDFHEVIELYLEEAGDRVEDLQAKLNVDDFWAVGSVAHSLKGSSASLGALRLASLCSEIEHSPRDSTRLQGLVNEVAAEFEIVHRALSQELQ